MGDIKVGDQLFDENGKVCRVTFVTDTQYGRPCNRVVFSDGAEIIADDEHQWLTWDKCARKNSRRNVKNSSKNRPRSTNNYRPKVRTTLQIAQTLTWGSYNEANHSIPTCAPIECPPADLLISPYTLGAWLGDGSSRNAQVYFDDEQIAQEIRKDGFSCVKGNAKFLWSTATGHSRAGFIFRAKKLGIYRNKHIPPVYLRASPEQRLALLQGLMDTDGYACSQCLGNCEFTSVNRRLALDVMDLLMGLGIKAVLCIGKATIKGRYISEKYRINFTTALPVFRLQRKLARQQGGKKKFRVDHRFIRDVTPIESVPVKCIQVDSPNSLFLAGKSYIPTHNTLAMTTIAANYALHQKKVGLFTPEYKQLSEPFIALKYMLASMIETANKNDGTIRLKGGGVIDFWTLNDNELAGRGREYDLVCIDEAAFTKADQMINIWNKSIKPTMLTTRGSAWVFSTPNGVQQDNFFYRLWHDPEMGFQKFHAPTSTNPYVPPDELEKERLANHPLVWQQEFLAEFISWESAAFFKLDFFLVDGKPVPFPEKCDAVFAVLDTAVKSGTQHDATAVLYCATSQLHGPKLVWLDYEMYNIEAASLEYLAPRILEKLEALAAQCKARNGSVGMLVEDTAGGTILLQQARSQGWPIKALDSKLTQKGKDERALIAGGPAFRGDCKISQPCFDKTMEWRGRTLNHLLQQVTGFRIGDKDAYKRADDLLDTACYSIITACTDTIAIGL